MISTTVPWSLSPTPSLAGPWVISMRQISESNFPNIFQQFVASWQCFSGNLASLRKHFLFWFATEIFNYFLPNLIIGMVVAELNQALTDSVFEVPRLAGLQKLGISKSRHCNDCIRRREYRRSDKSNMIQMVGVHADLSRPSITFCLWDAGDYR